MTDHKKRDDAAQAADTANLDDPAMRMAAEITDIEEPENALPPADFDSLPGKVRKACEQAGWNMLMPVQERSIPYLLARRDLMVQSRTGSGKTGAYLLPCMERIDIQQNDTQVLILVPTRELALQVEHEANVLYAGSGIRTAAVYGGVGFGKQLKALEEGAHVVVGTPGRVLDHLLRRTLLVDRVRILIFDEADRMLSIGFYPDMVEVKRYLPKKRTTFLLSATYPPHVIKLAGEFMTKPAMLSLSHRQVHIVDTPHAFYDAKPMEKDRVLVRVLETLNPASAIIFCNTKANVHYVTAVLKGFGYNADELSADLSQSKRESVLKKLREGNVRFLVATDVAARGIDIPDLSHVILYEPPEDRESYIHRAGRTGRAGASGEVISLVDIMQKMELQRIASHYNIDLEHRDTPRDEDVAKVAGDRLTALLEAKYRKKTPLERERMQRFMPLLKDMMHDGEQLGLIAQLLDELYQQTLHAAPPAPTGESNDGGRGGYKRGGNPKRNNSGSGGRSRKNDGASSGKRNGGKQDGDTGNKPKTNRGRKRQPQKKNQQDSQ